jgi:hypothetical protein
VKINLQDNVASRQDLKAVVMDVRKYAQWYAQTTVKMKYSAAQSYELPVISPAATNIINEWNKEDPVSPKSLDELIMALDDFEASAPRMTITLAAPAPNSLKMTILKWCRENVAPNMLVDFKFNSTMLGGMVVQYGSHVYDWSFRQRILDARNKFPEVLRSV